MGLLLILVHGDQDPKATLSTGRVLESAPYKLDLEDPAVYSDGEGHIKWFPREEWPERPKPKKRPTTVSRTVPTAAAGSDSQLDKVEKELVPIIQKGTKVLKDLGYSISVPSEGKRVGLVEQDFTSSVCCVQIWYSLQMQITLPD